MAESVKERKEGTEERRTAGGNRKARLIVINVIRAVLVLAFVLALYSDRRLILFMSIFGVLLTFVPVASEKILGVKIPAQFELLIIFFLYGLLFYGEIRGAYAGLGILSAVLNVSSAVVLGLTGLAVMHTLYKKERIHGSPIIIAFFSFCFAVAVGTVWEFMQFMLDSFFGFNIQNTGVLGPMGDLSMNIVGAFIVSTAGYFYIKRGKASVVSRLVEGFVEANSKFFGIRASELPHERVSNLSRKGEGEKLEFKSSLRTNLHTKNVDRKIEHAVLKTVNAYLNSDGGTLLVGVANNGDIMGLEHDRFDSKDALNRHFTSLVKSHIGGEFLPYVKSEVSELYGIHVLMVDCDKSHKEVFLKMGNIEEFYIRTGAASMPMHGSSLVEYINTNFRKK